MMKKKDIRELVKKLGLNNPEIEIYEVDDFLHVISKFNNGNYYNFYNANNDNCDMAGPYIDLEEAQSFLLAKYNNVILTYKYEKPKEQIEKVVNLYEWELPFYLTNAINEEYIESAQTYLAEDDMIKYCAKNLLKYLTSVRYVLYTQEKGSIQLIMTVNKLSKKLKKKILVWLNDLQDAINDGITSQDWANLDNGEVINISELVDEFNYIGEYVEEENTKCQK